MDRQIVFSGAIPQDVDQLSQSKNVMIGLGYLIQAILGAGTWVDGLACTPTGPAGMTVNVGPGSIYAVENVDGSAYGSLAPDTTHQIMKQGLVINTTNLSCPAPSTSGQSIVYLIEAAYEDVDGGSVVLPYYNASNPAMAYNGPNNTGVSQNTVRQGVCQIQVKAGVAATTGTQVTPAPDAGFTGLFAVTVANGQTTITSGSIAQLASAPFISPKLTAVLPALQSGAAIYAADTSGAANTLTIALAPALGALGSGGQPVFIKVANTNTGAVVINTNGLGNVAANLQNGNAIPSGMLQANGIYGFIYDGNHWQLQSPLSGALAVGQCVFTDTSGTVCTLLPKGGNKVMFPNGAIAVIPSAGIATTVTNAYLNGVSGQTLASSTLYYAYLANIGGTYVIDWSATGHATDASGIEIKSGDSTRVLVGAAYINGSGNFIYIVASKWVRSWFNDHGIVLSNNFTTTRSTTSATATEIHTEIRCNAVLWAGENVNVVASGVVANSTGGQGVGSGIGVDSTSAISGSQSGGISVVGGNGTASSSSYTANTLSEGLHFFTWLGFANSSGTVSFSALDFITVSTNR